MGIKIKKPITSAQRFYVSYSFKNKFGINFKKKKKLTIYNHRSQGRNSYGRITSRFRGGGHKRLYRVIDFKRNKLDIPAKVNSIEYDPNRSANISLLIYRDGEKRYIISPNGIKIGDIILNHSQYTEKFSVGDSLILKFIPTGTFINSIEIEPKRGAVISRSAGSKTQLLSIKKNRAILKISSGEIRTVHINCRATIGSIGNSNWQLSNFGKAGRSRWKNKRPHVRGVAMNPVDHPMGGGEGKTSGGGHPVSPWGKLSKGLLTRKKSKKTNKYIIRRKSGKKLLKN
jgi:large subunit ribosomal protein L2